MNVLISKRVWKILPFIIMLGLIGVILFGLYHDADIRYALISSKDEADIKYAEYTIKNTCEFGWYFENARTNGGAGELYDHSMGDFIQFSIVRLLGCFTDNVDLIYNIMYFATYFLCAVSMYIVARLLQMSRTTSAVMGMLFTFLPWHQLRLHHLFSSVFYVIVPIAVLISIWIADGQVWGEKTVTLGKISINKKYTWICILVIFTSITDVMWSAFNCYVLAIAIFISAFRDQTAKSVFRNIKLLLLEILGTIAMYSPVLIHYIRTGVNTKAAAYTRSADQAEHYGMKLINLLMPRANHRIQKLADISEIYKNHVGENENINISLGIIVSVGFALLLFQLMKREKEKEISSLAVLNIGTILVGTVGGIGAIVAYLVPQIRTYNRISLYIAAYSIIYLGIISEKLREKTKKTVWITLLFLVTAVAVFDSTVKYDNEYQKSVIAETDSTEKFVAEIESVMPKGTRIYELPYMMFPEGGGYDLVDGYLYSDHLIWSFGSIKGTKEAAWQEKLSQISVEELCEQITLEDYRGIYVDLNYMNKSETYDAGSFVTDMTNFLGEEPIYSEDGTKCFWNITSFSESYLRQIGTANKDYYKMPFVSNIEGFSDKSVDGDGLEFRWCDGNGIITVCNRTNVAREAILSFRVNSYADYDNKMMLYLQDESYLINVSGNYKENDQKVVNITLDLQPGDNQIYLKSDLDVLEEPKGIIKKTFMIKDFKVTWK